jgi:hypothetical protein
MNIWQKTVISKGNSKFIYSRFLGVFTHSCDYRMKEGRVNTARRREEYLVVAQRAKTTVGILWNGKLRDTTARYWTLSCTR